MTEGIRTPEENRANLCDHDEDYFPLTSESLAMREYLRSHGDLRWPDDSWIGVQTMIQIDFPVQSVLSVLENEGYGLRI